MLYTVPQSVVVVVVVLRNSSPAIFIDDLYIDIVALCTLALSYMYCTMKKCTRPYSTLFLRALLW
ncbi:hypothetical protein SCHPADRAFT_215033 [Schizopora paradoxa]|uniref:Uncharacterized protein n=1 Tax=Schizopora paradoxa TaxID=27342 RepID=A0A0H2SHC8_9AGAM|nr:hypothetical protein SCHPADRAFT_215033 [Schizopora paradoxa]